MNQRPADPNIIDLVRRSSAADDTGSMMELATECVERMIEDGLLSYDEDKDKVDVDLMRLRDYPAEVHTFVSGVMWWEKEEPSRLN